MITKSYNRNSKSSAFIQNGTHFTNFIKHDLDAINYKKFILKLFPDHKENKQLIKKKRKKKKLMKILTLIFFTNCNIHQNKNRERDKVLGKEKVQCLKDVSDE